MTSGLHSCKPGNEPQVGQVKTFVVQQMTGKSGKPYTKIRSANAENGGTPYKITKASPTGHTDSYGNVSFNIEIEPALNGTAPPNVSQQDYNSALGHHITTQQSQNTAFARDDRSNRIERQHSQEMAIRYCALHVGEPPPTTQKLRDLTSWFQRDIGHVPEAPVKQVAPDPKSEPTPDDNDEPPF